MSRRALLIASNFGELHGTLHDAMTMERVLAKRNFEITKCYGPDATRAGIFAAWNSLIEASSSGDAVVIFYSGHGGLVRDEDLKEKGKSWQFQFLVPIDYDQSTEDDFRGILDIEISYLLRDTTEKTRNVTIITDCCHSGRMFRAPEDDPVHQKNLGKVEFRNLERFLKHKREEGVFHGDVSGLGNPYAVRIAAAATGESACEHMNGRGEWAGALTEALARAIEEVHSAEVSWRTTLVRVGQLVSTRHQWQHPQVEGPDTRAQFSMQHVRSGALFVKLVDNIAMIDAGSVVGVQKGNVYTVIPFDSDEAVADEEAPTATVTAVSAFKSKAKMSYIPSWGGIRHEGAMAFLKVDMFNRAPVTVPSTLPDLEDAIKESRYIKSSSDEDPLLDIKHEDQALTLYNRQSVQISTRPIDTVEASIQAYHDIIADAERLARAQRVLDLTCDRKQDHLAHKLQITVGVVEDGEPIRKFSWKNDSITEGEYIYFRLENGGNSTIHVSVFDINITGVISLLTASWPFGIELPPGHDVTLGSNAFDELEGSPISWPESVSRALPVEEQFMFFVSNQPINLNYMVDSVNEDVGIMRDAAEFVKTAAIHYDIMHRPFTLYPVTIEKPTSPDPGDETASEVFYDALDEDDWDGEKEEGTREIAILATELPEPEMPEGWDTPVDGEPDGVEKGLFGAIFRAGRNIPPSIRVINHHSEEITVVVSKYKPNRLLSDISLNASATGGGVQFSTTTFNGPATKKTLMPLGKFPEDSTATFPLWSRNEGFGVISIFKGPERVLFIENDRVPAGTTAYFLNRPNLKMETGAYE